MKNFLTFAGIFIGIVAVFILFILMEQGVAVLKAREVKLEAVNDQLIRDAYVMGAGIYRANVLLLVDDSIISQLDTLFIWETRDINDTLAIEALKHFDL